MNVGQKCICRRCDDRTRFNSSRSGFFHRSQIPANAKTESSARVKQKGDFPLLNFESSRGPTLRLGPPLRTVRESFQLARTVQVSGNAQIMNAHGTERTRGVWRD